MCKKGTRVPENNRRFAKRNQTKGSFGHFGG